MTMLNRFKTFLVACVFVGFAANATAQTDWASELGSYEGQTLRIIMIQDPWVGAFDTINADFEAITGANVIIDAFGYDETYNKEVLAGSSGSAEYDVIVLDSPWIGQFAESGFVEDLTPYIEQDADIVEFDDFVDVFQEVSRWNTTVPIFSKKLDSTQSRPSKTSALPLSSSPTTPTTPTSSARHSTTNVAPPSAKPGLSTSSTSAASRSKACTPDRPTPTPT